MLVDGGFDAIEIHLGHNYLLERVPLTEAQPARRRMGWQPREPRAVSRVRSCRRSATPSAIGVAVTAKLNMADGVDGRPVVGREHRRRAACSKPTARSTRSRSPAAARSRTRCTCSAATRRSRRWPRRSPARSGPASSCSPRGSSRSTPSRRRTSFQYARQFRDALTMPLILLGGIDRLDTIEHALHDGFRVRADGARTAARARPPAPDAGRRARTSRCASTATSACRRSTVARDACWSIPAGSGEVTS